jgi:hypothetical protein
MHAKLALLAGVGRREVHVAATEQHERRDAARRFSDERRAGRHLEREIGCLQREVVDRVELRRVEGNLQQTIERRDLEDRVDLVAIGRVRFRTNGQLPRRDAARASATHEHVGEHFESACDLPPCAFADGRLHDRAARERLIDRLEIGGRERRRAERAEIVGPVGGKRGLDIGEQPHDSVGLRRSDLRRAGLRRGAHQGQNEETERQSAHREVL